MSTALQYIIGIVLSVIGEIANSLIAYNSGKKTEKLDNAEKSLDDVEKANSVRFDDSFDDELHERYDL